MMQQNKTLHMVAFLLLVVGGLNWLLVGLLNFDLVMWLFVDLLGMMIVAKVVYILVGLAAIYELLTHKSGESGGNAPARPAMDNSGMNNNTSV